MIAIGTMRADDFMTASIVRTFGTIRQQLPTSCGYESCKRMQALQQLPYKVSSGISCSTVDVWRYKARAKGTFSTVGMSCS